MTFNIDCGIDNFHMHYLSLDDVVSHIKQLGKRTFIAKLDLENAFKFIPVQKEDLPLLGSTFTFYGSRPYTAH